MQNYWGDLTVVPTSVIKTRKADRYKVGQAHILCIHTYMLCMLKTLLNNLIVLQEEIETGPPIIQKQIEGAYKLWSRSIYRNAQNAI